MAILSIVIGIVFILLLFSLLATTVMELLASFLRLRGHNLIKALRNMLASCDQNETLLKDFKNNSLYKQLTQQYGRRSQGPPSYMSAETFQSILFDIILRGESYSKLKERIDGLPDDDLRNVLNQLLREANNELDVFKLEVQNWYNNVMDRASGWYKRYTQQILIGVGLAIALIFNADTISIYNRLESNPGTLSEIVDMAESYVQTRESVDGLSSGTDRSFEENVARLDDLIGNEIENVRSPLGLGWSDVDLRTFSFYDYLLKLLGFLLTALAVSLGAPFWFDLLRKFVNIRSAGDRPSA